MTDLIKRDDAPEKIVAWGWGSPKTSGCYPHECHWMGAGYAHYIRADLADPAAIRKAALQEAYDSLFRNPGFNHAISGQNFKAVKLEDAAEGIIALIKGETK